MKYSEFRDYLKLNKISLKEYEEKLIADDQFEISKIEEYKIIFLGDLLDFPYECDLNKKAIELAETPLDEREEEKKYYLKHKFINNYSTKNYINVVATENVILSSRLCEDHVFKTKFTKAEIQKFKEKFDTDLKDFELVRVED